MAVIVFYHGIFYCSKLFSICIFINSTQSELIREKETNVLNHAMSVVMMSSNDVVAMSK